MHDLGSCSLGCLDAGREMHAPNSAHRSFTVTCGLSLACLALLLLRPTESQSPPYSPGALRTDKVAEATPINQPPDANAQLRARARRIKLKNFDAANALRLRQITDESAKLLILVRDLKAQIEKSEGAPIPALLIREVEVIEILAHDVQTKMTLIEGAG